MGSEAVNDTLSRDDVGAMVRLIGDVAASRRDHSGQKRMLMDGLCKIIGADAWSWTLACQFESEKPPVHVGFMYGGFSEERFPKFLRAIDHPATAALLRPLIALTRQRQDQTTQTVEELAPGSFDTSGAAPLWGEAGIGTLLLSARPLDGRTASSIGVYRNAPAQPFTERETSIAHIILREVGWLHEQGWPEDRGATVPRLYPRQRLILNLLLEGRRRKDIATQLHLSEHTVSGYMKEIFRHFEVNSHVALMRRFQNAEEGVAA